MLFSDSIAQPAPGRCRSEGVWDFPTSILQSKVRVCAAERSNESPSGAFKRQNGLRQQMEGLRPDKFADVYTSALLAYSMTAFSHQKNSLGKLRSCQVKIKRTFIIKPFVSKKSLKLAVIFVQNEMHAAKVSCMKKWRSYFRLLVSNPEVRPPKKSTRFLL